MFSTRIYLKIVFQVALILLVTGVGLTGIITGKAIILGCVTLLIALWLVGILVYFLNTSNRRIQLFLDAIEDNESMLYFPENSGPEEQRRLHTAFNRIHRLMTEKPEYREVLKKKTKDEDGQIDISWINEDLITFVKDRLGHDQRYAIDPAKITAALGWYPETKFEDGIVKTIEWYLNNQAWVEEVTSGDYQHYYEKMYGKR